MDGTLINTEPLWRHTVVETLDELYQCQIDEQDIHPFTGCTTYVVCVQLALRFPNASISPERLSDAIAAKMIQRSPQADLLPGAIELLEFIDTQGGKLAIASSSPLSVIDRVVAIHQLPIPIRVSSYEAIRSKPHPHVFELAAKKLQVAPEDCMAWEDSLNGAISAYAAGMQVIAVPEWHEGVSYQFSFASEIHRSLNESLSWLLSQ